MRRIILLVFFTLAYTLNWAQIPDEYYNPCIGYKGAALKTALFHLIDEHKVRTYNELWTDMQVTDSKEDGSLWDMYSSATHYTFIEDQCGNFTKEGSCYNREHSFPKSWFYSDDSSPMYTDLFHLYPVDGWVNNMRSNLPYGETNNPSKTSQNGFSKVGPSSINGYSGKVFEPADEYKGDLARTYFYMATRYEDLIASWDADMLSGDRYSAYTSWALTMLLRWSKEDPVSEKETRRNNTIYTIQGNRNPFIDFAGLEQYIWGSKTSIAFDPLNYVSGWDDKNEGEENEGGTPVPPNKEDDSDEDPVSGLQIFKKICCPEELTVGNYYLIVCESKKTAVSEQGNNIRTYAEITLSDEQHINGEVNKKGLPFQFRLGGDENGYTLYDSANQSYLALNSNDNKLHTASNATTDNAKWLISVSESSTSITNKCYLERSIQYNPSAPRFACYKSKQQAISLYVNLGPANNLKSVTDNLEDKISVYTLDGRTIYKNISRKNALQVLAPGMYIIGNAKYIIR